LSSTASGGVLFERYLPALSPITVAVSGISNGEDLAVRLFALSRPGCRVILSDDRVTEEMQRELERVAKPAVLVLDDAALRLTFVEAKVVAARSVSDGELLRLLEESEHAFETFLVLLGRARGRAGQPAGPDGVPVDSRELEIDALLEAGEWREAAELAVREAPHRAAAVLREVAPLFHENGLHQAFWRLLECVRNGSGEDEAIQFWRLSAAVRLERAEEVRVAVERHLDDHEAPNLRALHAGVFLEPAEAREEVERAYRAERTPFTAYQHGRGLSAANEGAVVLREAVWLAERYGRAYEVSRNASALTARLIDAGEYLEAAYWGEWALEHFDRLDLGDAQQRLYILNNLAYARLLTGESVGLEALLRDAERDLAGSFPGLRAQFRSTLGDYFLALERTEEALEYYRANYDQAPRKMKGIRGLSLVRALLERGPGEFEHARAVAEEVNALNGIDAWDYRRSAVLALGMVLATCDPDSAGKHLLRVLNHEAETLPAPQRAQATLYLACSRLASGEASEARSIVTGCAVGLASLSDTGLRLLAGPEARFREIWNWCRGGAPALELRFLGRRDVLVDGEPVPLGLQQCALLALLAHYAEGLAPMRLLTYLKPEGGNAALHTAVSKLRKVVPITSSPYRLEVGFRADFIEALRLLREGRLRQALELYRGPLLEDSDAPGIAELRSFVDESFRQATLGSRDPEASLTLAQRAVDDLELWEHAHETLTKNDPRALMARARVTQLRREY
jgi:tetratricopeptide (TPR) repeat protein